MKRNITLLLCLFISNIVFAQSAPQLKYGFMQSRNYKFNIGNKIDSSRYVGAAFDTQKGLYPISLKENSNGANTIYYEENGVTKFFVFQGTIPKKIKYSDLDNFTKTIKTNRTTSKSVIFEKKDILFSCKAEGIEVIPKGTYQLHKSTLLGSGVTFFEASKKIYITDPKMFQYFDFPSKGVTPEKLCYNWQGADKEARLYHQGNTKYNDEVGNIYPAIEQFSSESSTIILKKDGLTELNNPRFTDVVMDLNAMFSSNNKPKLDTFYDINYKVRNDNKTYVIKVQFSSCENGTMPVERKKTDLNTIILPTDPNGNPAETCGVPSGTTVGLNPQP